MGSCCSSRPSDTGAPIKANQPTSLALVPVQENANNVVKTTTAVKSIRISDAEGAAVVEDLTSSEESGASGEMSYYSDCSQCENERQHKHK
jgi:hypothetical protein